MNKYDCSNFYTMNLDGNNEHENEIDRTDFVLILL